MTDLELIRAQIDYLNAETSRLQKTRCPRFVIAALIVCVVAPIVRPCIAC